MGRGGGGGCLKRQKKRTEVEPRAHNNRKTFVAWRVLGLHGSIEGPENLILIIDYTGRLRPKRVYFSIRLEVYT